jgi:ABC-2 type transport system permease protein
MNFEKSYIIAIKDMKEVFSSTAIYGPMIGIPIFFAIVLPLMTVYVALHAAPSIAARIVSMPVLPGSSISSVKFMVFFSVNILGTIFLTIPIITASVIAADSFAGEKERKTAEALLSSPASNSELLLGKILASLIPTIVLTVLVFAIYGIVTNILSSNAFGVDVLPTPSWLMMLLLSPFLAVAAISVVVLISSHVRGIKEAQQLSSLLVLPIIILPFASIAGFANLSVRFFAYSIIALAIVDAIILWVSIKGFKREALL